MFIINPPWPLQGVLCDVMPYLAKVLGKERKGEFTLEFEENAAA
jgi:23S rRNA A2030 N6-methylase RlmJ